MIGDLIYRRKPVQTMIYSHPARPSAYYTVYRNGRPVRRVRRSHKAAMRDLWLALVFLIGFALCGLLSGYMAGR